MEAITTDSHVLYTDSHREGKGEGRGKGNLKTDNRGQNTDVGGRRTEAITTDSHGLHTDSHREGKG